MSAAKAQKIDTFEKAFRNVFQDVPGLTIEKPSINNWNLEVRLNKDSIFGFDVAIKTSTGEHWTIVVQTRASGEPRHIRESCFRLRERLGSTGDKVYPVVAATYISKRSADICKEMDVGYLDLSGNCRMAFNGVYIERSVPENKNIEEKPLKTIFSVKTSRVVRIFLEHPDRSWRVQELATEADISLGLAYKAKEKLMEIDALFSREQLDRNGFQLRDPFVLLEDWSSHYSVKDSEILQCYSSGSVSENEKRLSEYLLEAQMKGAYTLYSAANRLAPHVRGVSLSSMYVEANLNQVASELGWKPVSSGGNVLLLRPFDNYLLYNGQTNNGEPVVSDIQLYLDLKTYRSGRADEAAEFLFEQKIKPKWNIWRRRQDDVSQSR